MKKRIKELTKRSNGMSYVKRREKLNSFVRGWTNYFKLAEMTRFLKNFDGYFRRRIRMMYWKLWKQPRTRYAYLRKLGIQKDRAIKQANSRKAYWRTANSPVLKRGLNNGFLRQTGYIFFYDYYQKIR